MDIGHREADDELKALEERVKEEYKNASEEIKKRADEYFGQFKEEDEKMLEKLKNEEITEKDYLAWRETKILTGKRFNAVKESLAQDFVNADKIAMSMVYKTLPKVYAANVNFGAYEAEKGSKIDTSFAIYDTDTVERLIKENPKILPKPKVDVPADKKWHKKKMTSALLQGILQGDTMDKISERLQSVTDMDEKAAIRNARTMVTGAENAGRNDAYRRAENMGIGIRKIWLATLDGRTRHTHRMLDGTYIGVDGKFDNGCRYPGDPDGSPEEVYNCRCTLIAAVKGSDMWDSLDGVDRYGYTNEEDYLAWKTAKTPPKKFKIVEGRDISKSWIRRPELFAFEIEDAINAQEFDGLPRIVSADEFDKAVQEANDGNGFVGQRSYSAPDQETIDAYRKQLYEGKWYVDCSTGGAQYGQGMYCAASYDGKLSEGIKTEMQHYAELNREKLSKNFSGMSQREQREMLPSIIDELAPNLTSTQRKDFIDYFTYDRLGGAWDDTISFERAKEARTALLNSGVNISKLGVSIDEYRTSVYSYTETMTLDPSAKIITYLDLLDEQSKEGNVGDFYLSRIRSLDLTEEEKAIAIESHSREIWDASSLKESDNETIEHYLKLYEDIQERDVDEADAIEQSFWEKWGDYKDVGKERREYEKAGKKLRELNPGSYAALKGYDAINAEGHGQSGSYTVVLNRTKLIIKEPE